MKRIQQLIVLCLVLIFAAMAVPPAMAATQPDPPKAPIPAQILAARTIFIANGGEYAWFEQNQSLVYNSFYSKMQGWGRYKLVGTPAEADLVYEVSLLPDLSVSLTIIDSHTHTVLWRIIEGVQVANLASTGRKNCETSVQALFTDAMALVSPQTAAPVGNQ